jgi:hypothetical protein
VNHTPIALLTLALIPALSTAAAPPPHAASTWSTYRSADYGFSIRYPSSFTFYSSHPDIRQTRLSMFPVCDDTTVACFEYNRGDNKNSDVQAIGLSVNVLRDRKTEQACYLPDQDSTTLKPQLIHGIEFRKGEAGSAGLGSSSGGDIYHAFRQGVCFEVAVFTAIADGWSVEDSGPRFPAAKMRRISHDLDIMLQSFTFTGPIKDGAAWDVYSDSCCGIQFEYPQGDKVELTTDYQPHAPPSRLTSSQHFIHGNKDYTIAVKDGNGRPYVLDPWLVAMGYPPMSDAKLLTKTEPCKEYHAEPYYYIACGADLYIFSVSDALHQAVSPQGDPVFTHLLSTFKVD